MWDLKLLELRFELAQRFFPAINESGKEQKALVGRDARTFGVEAARYFTTHQRHYGRLGAGVLQFSPEALTYLKLSLNNGILDTDEQPWTLRLDGSLLFNLPSTVDQYQKGGVLALRAETLGRLSLASSTIVRFGGFLAWTNRMTDLTGAPQGRYEFMLFSFGPQGEVDLGKTGKLRLSVNVRLFLDKEVLPTSAIVTPSEMAAVPDISLGWAQSL